MVRDRRGVHQRDADLERRICDDESSVIWEKADFRGDVLDRAKTRSRVAETRTEVLACRTTSEEAMSYGSKGLNDLRDEALQIATEHGFKDATVGEDLMLIVSELAEALEDHRGGNEPDHLWYVDPTGGKHAHPHPRKEGGGFDLNHPRKPCGIPSEMADVIIRVLHFSGKHGIDIEQAVREKMAYNETREFKHGKKL